MSNRKWHSSKGWVGSLLVAAVSLAVAFSLVSHSRAVADNINYFRYQPSETIAAFVDRTGMSEKGKFFFYASHPVLEDARGFNARCGRAEAQTAILGCYNGQTIHIYDISDDRLAGIEETTAAHEMLHAAFDRLGKSEKQKVSKLLESEFKKLRSDKKLLARMEFYERTEPGEGINELHSIIGTEISALSPDLETYYGQYFTDRSKVVALHNQYESVFRRLQSRADDLSLQISRLDSKIKEDTAAYNKEAEVLRSDIATFNDRAQSGNFDSVAEFNVQRQNLTARVESLENLRITINTAVQEYNRLVAELNGIATQTEDLNRSLDSTLAPAPTL